MIRLVLALKVDRARPRPFRACGARSSRCSRDLLGRGVYPCVPAKGSVGASGDLTPLAHLSAILIGVGEATHRGRRMPAAEALAIAGLTPIELGPKEGLALINGTQVSTALALAGLFAAEDVFAAAIVAGALSRRGGAGAAACRSTRASMTSAAIRGRSTSPRAFRALFEGSGIMAEHGNRHRVQDPYSLRCQPQVMGALPRCDALRRAARLTIEANAVSDNPLMFPDDGDVLSGGNFHAEPVAIGADLLAIALAEVGAISERRIAFLVDASLSRPAAVPGRVERPQLGLHGGADFGGGARLREQDAGASGKRRQSIPTAANQEDHV